MSFAAADPDPVDDDTSPEPLLGNQARKQREILSPRTSESIRRSKLSDTPAHTLSAKAKAGQSCLVQIYPADFVEGMLLIESDELIIGRDSDVDLVISDISVSRRHARIVRTGAGYRIVDLDSTNGTYVDGKQVDESPLKSGDTIRIGTFLFKFLSAGSVESQYHETVYSALTRDALTGTMNQRYLLETLNRSIATAIRQKTPVCIVMVDVDNFKSVNDSSGHLVGDEVLREFAQRISASCRPDDMLARYGGEEFCLLMTATTLDEAVAVADGCRQAICEHAFDTAIGPLDITASFGVACLDAKQSGSESAEAAKKLIHRADEKLYQAKRGGRNRVVW